MSPASLLYWLVHSVYSSVGVQWQLPHGQEHSSHKHVGNTYHLYIVSAHRSFQAQFNSLWPDDGKHWLELQFRSAADSLSHSKLDLATQRRDLCLEQYVLVLQEREVVGWHVPVTFANFLNGKSGDRQVITAFCGPWLSVHSVITWYTIQFLLRYFI